MVSGKRVTSRLVSRDTRLCSGNSASSRFISRQNNYCTGQVDLLDGWFARQADKTAGEQIGEKTCAKTRYISQSYHYFFNCFHKQSIALYILFVTIPSSVSAKKKKENKPHPNTKSQQRDFL